MRHRGIVIQKVFKKWTNMFSIKISWQELTFLFFMCPLGGRMEKRPCLKTRSSVPLAGCGRILSGARIWSVQWMIKVWKLWEKSFLHTYASDFCSYIEDLQKQCVFTINLLLPGRVGIWNNPPSRPPTKVLGSIREDVPHQPPETLDPAPP